MRSAYTGEVYFKAIVARGNKYDYVVIALRVVSIVPRCGANKNTNSNVCGSSVALRAVVWLSCLLGGLVWMSGSSRGWVS